MERAAARGTVAFAFVLQLWQYAVDIPLLSRSKQFLHLDFIFFVERLGLLVTCVLIKSTVEEVMSRAAGFGFAEW